ncbi:hypothetical protein F0562_007299 [Nyssa sinensis]|uniref:Uncharacterized protein n=1 Tax=Nyssa sinensis TaxID=561372 RepID=A0A5J5A5H9_9ASTE|nr:hypothetical protein F0562_007299 [Nyssa sinensis]
MAAARPWVSVVSHDSDTATDGAANTFPFPDVMRASIRPNIPTEPHQKFSRTVPTLIDFLSKAYCSCFSGHDHRLEYTLGWGIGPQTPYLNGSLFRKRIKPHIAKNPLTGFSTGDRDFRLEALNLSSEPQRQELNQDSGLVAPAGKKPDSYTASHMYRAFSSIFTKIGNIKLLGSLFPVDLFFLRFFLKISGVALDMTLNDLIKNN